MLVSLLAAKPPTLPPEGLQLTVTRDARRVEIQASGELDLASADALAASLQAAADVGELLLDLSAITFLDSTGVLLLLRAQQLPGQLQIIASDRVRRVLELAGVAEHLPLQDP